MYINVRFDNTQEMMDFCRMMGELALSDGGQAIAAAAAAEMVTQPVSEQQAETPTAPVEPQPTPVQQPATVQASVTVPTAPARQPAPQQPVSQQVPTSAATYTLDDLARAAMTLMDAGRQAELQQLLVTFGVEALPSLPPAQYGAFATALREKGAQI